MKGENNMEVDFQKVAIEMAYKIAQLELNLTIEQNKVTQLLAEMERLQEELNRKEENNEK